MILAVLSSIICQRSSRVGSTRGERDEFGNTEAGGRQSRGWGG